MSLAGAEEKLTQINRRQNSRNVVDLGIPAPAARRVGAVRNKSIDSSTKHTPASLL
jgi:hypothetical protein